ncbi:MAG: Eukaryotic translation initiation factor eIF-1 [Bathelium mastoideum]|nr:MAG: Eukaryotic translation initiation factor eIF-1 [Bathelium mastoideum]
MSSTLPMVAIFTRNKLVGWTAVIFALQAWLAETPEQKKTATTPTYFSVGMALMACAVAVWAALAQAQERLRPPLHREDAQLLLCMYLPLDPFAEADEDTGEQKQSQGNYIHIRIQQRNGRKTLTTVQGLPKKFDQKKILKVIKKEFACNGTIVNDTEMGEVIQLQGDQRKNVQEFLVDEKEGLGLDTKTIKVHGF